MLPGVSYALAGMQAAETRVAIRAENIANVMTPGYAAAVPVQTTTAIGPVVRAERLPPSRNLPTFIPPDLSFAESVALAEELVDLRLAKVAYEANIVTIRTADEMFRALLDIFA
jgi:flagellar hook protein FlgE